MNRTALVTGASAGLGAALARAYASHGWDLILTARREDRLADVAGALAVEFGVAAAIIPEDLSDPAAPLRLVREIEGRGLVVDALINNAGYSLTQGFLELSPADHAAMIQVMLSAPIELSRRLAPAMAERAFGRIMNVASLAGLMPATGGDTLYGPIKSFLIKASNGLHLELKGKGVHVSALCPGYTLTEFHDANGSREQVSGAYPSWMWMTAARVAEIAYRGLEANRPVVVPGAANKGLALLAKHLPDGLALKMVGKHAERLDRL